MKEENIILDKSYAFAVRIVRASQFLVKEYNAYQLADQLRRSGTSIGANVEEAVGGQSWWDFVAKRSIAYKEARETHYWLRLLRDTCSLEEKQAESFIKDCKELRKILTAILVSTKSNELNS